MASGHRVNGVDWDDLFDPDIVGDGPSAPGYRKNGVALKYAKLSYGTKRADIGRRQANVDVTNLWAQKNSATYVNRGGVPDDITHEVFANPGGANAFAFLVHRRNGTVEHSNGAGVWSPGTGFPGDAYDIMYTYLGTGTGGGTLTGATGAWQQVNADRQVSYAVSTIGGASIIGRRDINVKVRRRSDSVVLLNYNCSLNAIITGDG